MKEKKVIFSVIGTLTLQMIIIQVVSVLTLFISTMGMTILYYSVVLVLFEEIFFRGYAFKKIEDNSSIAQAILITAAMNASWYLGFFDDRGILHLFGNLYSDMGLLTLIRMLVGLIAGPVLFLPKM